MTETNPHAGSARLELALVSGNVSDDYRIRRHVDFLFSILVFQRPTSVKYIVAASLPLPVRGIVKASLSDIKENSFIGVTGMPQADGTQITRPRCWSA